MAVEFLTATDKVNKDLAKFGYQQRVKNLEIMYHNVESWRAFLLICDQIILSEGRVVRFDYVSIEKLLGWNEVKITKDLIQRVRFCEVEYLKKLRGR